MIPKQHLKSSILLAAALVCSTAATQAALYRISLDTTVLTSGLNSPKGPFSLDFQLNDGNALDNNSATISNITFTGGNASGIATRDGGATGDLFGTIVLTESSAFNSLFQSFSSGTTMIEFDLDLTANVAAGQTPDSFSVGILQDNPFGAISTSGLGGTLLQMEIDSTTPTEGDFIITPGNGDFNGLTVTAVPEPTSAVCAVLALGLGALRRRRSA